MPAFANTDSFKFNRDSFRSFGRQAVLILSMLVVVSVFWSLKLTGITMAGEAFCGMDEHVHTEACYETEEVCAIEEHIHTRS